MRRRLLSEAITSALAPFDFIRRGTRWYRDAGDITDVVSLTTSKSGDSVSVELGVFDPAPYQLVWPLPKTITEADCVVRVGLGRLGDAIGLWDPSDPDAVTLIVNVLLEQGVAWLDSMHSTRQRIEQLRDRRLAPGEAVLLALTEALAGNVPEARSRLNELRAQVDGPWVAKIDGLLEHLNAAQT